MTTAFTLLILIGGLVFLYSGEKKQDIIGKAELIIDFGGGNKRAFEGNIVKNETLIDALNQASRVGNFSYKIDGKNNLSTINNFANSQNKAWRWYLNDEKIDSLANGIVLKANDKILVKYE